MLETIKVKSLLANIVHKEISQIFSEGAYAITTFFFFIIPTLYYSVWHVVAGMTNPSWSTQDFLSFNRKGLTSVLDKLG